MRLRFHAPGSFAKDKGDDQTRDLVAAVRGIADDITVQAGADWHATQKGRQAVAAGVRHYLETMAPPVLAGKAADDLFGPDDPETLGRASARYYRRQYQEMQEMRLDDLREDDD